MQISGSFSPHLLAEQQANITKKKLKKRISRNQKAIKHCRAHFSHNSRNKML